MSKSLEVIMKRIKNARKMRAGSESKTFNRVKFFAFWAMGNETFY